MLNANDRLGGVIAGVVGIQNELKQKAFLHLTIRDNPKLPNAGQHAARVYGVPTDSTTRMVCPEGTPNAGALTDLHMTNCNIPSAENQRELSKLNQLELDKLNALIDEHDNSSEDDLAELLDDGEDVQNVPNQKPERSRKGEYWQ